MRYLRIPHGTMTDIVITGLDISILSICLPFKYYWVYFVYDLEQNFIKFHLTTDQFTCPGPSSSRICPAQHHWHHSEGNYFFEACSCPKKDVLYMFYTQFHSPRPIFYLPSWKCTRIIFIVVICHHHYCPHFHHHHCHRHHQQQQYHHHHYWGLQWETVVEVLSRRSAIPHRCHGFLNEISLWDIQHSECSPCEAVSHKPYWFVSDVELLASRTV